MNANVINDNSDMRLYLRNLSLFYLKIQAKYLIPSSTIQHIIADIQDVHKLGQSYLSQKLCEKITKYFDLPECTVKEIIQEVVSCDLFEKCTEENLRSDHCRSRTSRELFNHVEPVSIQLGRNASQKPCTLQYVTITDTISNLFKNKSVQEEYQNTCYPNYIGCTGYSDVTGKVFSDITDGMVFKKNILYRNEPNSLRLVLYKDAFEICNPLGSSKKKHKIFAVYLQILNFRHHLRSYVDQSQLVMLCLEKDFKYFGQQKVFGPLLNDLHHIILTPL